MVCGSHAKTRAMYSIPPCPNLAASTAAYRRRSFSDSQLKNRCIFRSTSAAYTAIPPSLIWDIICSKDTAAQAIREVILDHILREKPILAFGRIVVLKSTLDKRYSGTAATGRHGDGRWPEDSQAPANHD